ncbi:MAG: hypothetical protein ACXWLI_10650 [Myxococcaceae bacterium]
MRAAAAMGLLAALVACDAQTDTGYQGEPLVTLRGRVESSGELPPLEAAMLWQRGPPPSTNDEELATRAPVESGFPATFTIRLYQPPPAAARRTLAPGEVSFARGNAAAVPFGIATDQVPQLPGAQSPSYGVDVDHWVIHLGADVPPNSLTAWWLGAALPAGYHLLRVAAVDPACIGAAELEACVAALVVLGVPDDGTQDPGTARGFCLAPYRLSPAPGDELIVLHLGTYGPPAGGGPCP